MNENRFWLVHSIIIKNIWAYVAQILIHDSPPGTKSNFNRFILVENRFWLVYSAFIKSIWVHFTQISIYYGPICTKENFQKSILNEKCFQLDPSVFIENITWNILNIFSVSHKAREEKMRLTKSSSQNVLRHNIIPL